MAEALALTPARFRAGVLLPGAVLVVAAWVVLAATREHSSPASFVAMWIAMAVAMMVPTVVRPMLRAADGSVAGAWLFTCGFLAVWAVAGVPAFVLVTTFAWTPFWIAAAWFVAGVYQLTPFMQRHVVTCRSVKYQGDPAAYGMRQGLRCVASCLPVMIAVMVTAMAIPSAALSLAALLAVTVLLCWEKRPGVAPRAIASVGMAMLLLAGGGFVLLGSGTGMHHSAGTSRS